MDTNIPASILIPYPGFSQRFMRRFLIGWILSAASFALFVLFYALKLQWLSNVFAISFVLALLGALGTSFYSLKRIKCPKCTKRLMGKPDNKRETWVALCEPCDVIWDLGVGLGGPD